MTADRFDTVLDDQGMPRNGAPLGQLLTAQARCRPDSPALTFAGRTFSFAQVDATANRMARRFAANGVITGDRVIVSMPNHAEFIQSVYALWKLGATPCPVSPRLTITEWCETVALIEPRCVVGTDQTHPADAPLVNIHEPGLDAYSATPLAMAVATPGKIMCSGGSTGRAKLIIDPVSSVWGRDKVAPYRPPRSVSLAAGPLYHSAPFSYGIVALSEGTHVVLMEKFDPVEWLRLVERHRVQTTTMVPTMMSRIAKLPHELTASADLGSLSYLMHSAAPCPPEVKRWWIDRIGAHAIWEVYGGTERLGATVISGTEWLERPGSVGRAVPGDRIVILGEDLTTLPPGEIGEICFERAGGPGTNYSYIGGESRIRGALDSFGDMGWLDADGYLFIADRRTDMVLVGGVNVFPAEIEAALEGLPGVLCVAVVGLPDADLGNRLHAIVELAEDVAEPADGLAFIAPAAQALASFKRPRSVEFTHQRIRDDAGKVRRSALRAARIATP